jgi:hypothetical protein
MATTTNYSWTTPDNTAYVKDGASAIRTLGSSVDTSLFSITNGRNVGHSMVANATFSGATTYSANNVFSAAFDNYLVVLSGISVASLGNIEMRLRVSGTDNSSSNYRYGRIYIGALGSQALGGTDATTATTWPVVQAASSLTNNSATFEIKGPFLTANTSYSSFGSGNLLDINAGSMTVSTSYTGFTLQNSSGGNISGTVRIYGLRNTL